MSSRLDNIAVYKTHQEKAASCYCPACLGLQCLERPRYFAGQLLTEAELNSEQAYVIAKNKLHNRYLHGWGVVCGLQVVCHDCDGWVTVKQGYAIDPCGNDIIVCDDQDFDVLQAIRECRDGRRRRRRADCDPVRPPDDKSCKDVEEYWCVTIEYAEKEAHPTTTLRNELKKGKCGCGCGSSCGCGCGGGNGNGKSKGKTCGCGCQGGKGATTSTQGGTGVTNAQCEPTRIFEQYCLNVVEEPEHCSLRLKRNRFDLDTNSSLGRYMSALGIKKSQQATVSQVLSAVPPDSLFARILCCLLCLVEFIEKRLSAEDLSLLRVVVPQCRRGGSNANFPPEALHRLCCRLYQLVNDLYSENPLNVRCDYGCTPCPDLPAPDPDGSGVPANGSLTVASICCLVERLVQYAADCICLAFLPPCPANPIDDRLILACLTIKNGKIIHICNFSCRHYAGSFPSLYYWLSLVPIIPILGKVLQYICCNQNLFQTMFAAYQPDDNFRALGSDVTDDERREVKRRSISEAIRNFIMRSLSFENLADALKSKEAEEANLKDLQEQLKALKVEVDNLKRGGHT